MSFPTTPKPRRALFAFLLLFLIAYNVFRVALFFLTQSGAVKPDHPLDPAVDAVIGYSELAIGVVGLAGLPGIVCSRAWGFWVTVAASAYAVVFAGVSAVVVQPSAAGGVIPPVVVLLLLLALRLRFFPAGAESGGAPASHA